jgi:hypothetical protein
MANAVRVVLFGLTLGLLLSGATGAQEPAGSPLRWDSSAVAWDIIGAPQSARVHNDQVRQGRRAIGIIPSIGAAGLGLRVEMTF